MGIYDRPYYRDSRSFYNGRRTLFSSAIATMIIINVVIYLANALLTPRDSLIASTLSLTARDLTKPYMWWRLVTYGFVHDPLSLSHIFFNMIQLLFLGPAVERVYGRREFTLLYLAMIVFGGLVWCICETIAGTSPDLPLMGASGAVCGVVLLFALHFPKATLVLFPIPIPIRAWFLAILLIIFNLHGALADTDSNVAFTVHLAGMALAGIYFRMRWSFSDVVDNLRAKMLLRRRPRFRLRYPEEDRPVQEDTLEAEVDRILEKVSQHGLESLTPKEKKILVTAAEKRKRQMGNH